MAGAIFLVLFTIAPAALYVWAVSSHLSRESAAWGYGTGVAVLLCGILWLFSVAIRGGDPLFPCVIMISGFAVCASSAKKLGGSRK